MSDAVPVSLFLTRRALCPGCGAALKLNVDQSVIECEYCTATSYVERRLRTVEAELRGGLEPGQIEHKTRFIPAHSIAATGLAEAACPGCGSPVEITGSQDAATCPHCGSGAKVERRLVSGPETVWQTSDDDADLQAFAQSKPPDFHADTPEGFSSWETERANEHWDRIEDDRIRTLLTSADLDTQFRAARYFQGWRAMNDWRERMLARVIGLCCDAPAELQRCIAAYTINRLLAGSLATDATRKAVFRAAGRALFREGVSAPLLRELGLARDAAMLKLMLELAEYQLQHGRVDDARLALDGAQMAMGDYGLRFDIGEVMLYRLLYLTPPILAWVMAKWASWQVKDFWRIVEFVDDCAFERPELIPMIRERMGAPMPAANFAELRSLIGRIDKLMSPQAKEFALSKYGYDADGRAEDNATHELPHILEWLHARLGEPLFHRTARDLIVRLIGRLEVQELPPIHDFIQQHGEALPAHIRYRYLQLRPQTQLLKSFHPGNLYEDKSREPTPLEAEMAEWADKFRQAGASESRENKRLFKAMRDRIEAEDNVEYERRRAIKESAQQQQYRDNAARAEADAAAHKARAAEIDQQFDDWRKGGLAASERSHEEYRKLYEQTGDPTWLKLMESSKQTADMHRQKQLRKLQIARLPFHKRLLHRLMFWK